MNYSNTDCLGSPLTNSSPVAFNAMVRNNNCATFNGSSDYISLGANNILGEVDKVEFLYKGTRSTYHVFFTNIFKIQSDDNYGNILIFETATLLTFRYKGKQYTFTTTIGDDIFHRITIDVSGDTPSMTVDGVVAPFSSPTSTTTAYDNGSYIGFNGTNTNYLIKGSICDFKCYSGNTLLHWYPMAEGAGSIVYDAIGNINGTITSSSLTTFWETKQDVFAYNLINGYGKISGNDAKIPLNISSITYTEEHPKLDNGHNLAEPTLDFTQGISGIAELNALSGIDTYTTATTVSGLYKKIITTGEKNYLLYKQVQSGTNLQRINNKEKFYD